FLVSVQRSYYTLFAYTTLFRSGRIRDRVLGCTDCCFSSQSRNAADTLRRPECATSDGWHSCRKSICPSVVKAGRAGQLPPRPLIDRKSTRLNSSHVKISYAVFC